MRTALILLALVALSLEPASARSTADRGDFLRGVVVSCPRYGQIWDSAAMSDTLDSIRQLGANWVAIHPYAAVRRDGSLRFRRAEERDYLRGAVERARHAGVELFWKPHLAYWGSFAWRGAIDFNDQPANRKRFFADYREFIVDQARFAQQAGIQLFAVGVELEGTTRHEAEWRRIIADVRSVYKGQLTYAANWDRLELVPFWDAVDFIGVHAYFPLSQTEDPTSDDLTAGWDAPLAEIRRLSARFGDRPVIMAEIGYNRSRRAASEPWDARIQDDPSTRALRQRLMEIAIQRLEGEPLVRGMFWWKWIPGKDYFDRDFSMKDPEAIEILQRHWAKPEDV